MSPLLRLLCLAWFGLGGLACRQPNGPRILVFSRTAGYRHPSIEPARAAIRRLGADHGYRVESSEALAYLAPDSLAHYAAVVFLHTTGQFLERQQQLDFERYIRAGGGFVGIHAAADAEYDWRWYGRLVGGYFNGHTPVQPGQVEIVDRSNPTTSHLPAPAPPWSWTDEWYFFKRLATDLTPLLRVGSATSGPTRPLAWYHPYDGGRAWYTALGHTEEGWADPRFLQHVWGGIEYAVGPGRPIDYGQTPRILLPPESAFTRTLLVRGQLVEPTELAVLPNGDVLIAQRRGQIARYREADHSVRQVGKLEVHWQSGIEGVNAEDGLLGIQADPAFTRNHFIYLYYSPVDRSVNRLSRLVFERDTLDPKTEKVILEVPTDRRVCCHTGGSIAFGPDRSLYLSTGDNSTPFDQPNSRFATHGFAPLDTRPGFEQYDAERSSANSNDLRGKILRIAIRDDGSYRIPPGNLFPPGTANARPEIFVMGTRNPYRISVDQTTGFLYWGDVGPDAEADSLESRGPRGYDEINQARSAGFFGWPYFVGDNYPYRGFDYATGVSGAFFDPGRPANRSPNSTGLEVLPAAIPALLWYPYGDSPDFPPVGKGGRTAMAGPVYLAGRTAAAGALPPYFDRKLFIYEWIRGWIKVVTLAPNGDFEALEPFLEGTKLKAPIDLELGPDGRLYLLEYGSTWYAGNPDAGLSRIEYRAPAGTWEARGR
jgi:glucose/arabinose dehydrogenase/type 1 glutamine amidotransferase